MITFRAGPAMPMEMSLATYEAIHDALGGASELFAIGEFDRWHSRNGWPKDWSHFSQTLQPVGPRDRVFDLPKPRSFSSFAEHMKGPGRYLITGKALSRPKLFEERDIWPADKIIVTKGAQLGLRESIENWIVDAFVPCHATPKHSKTGVDFQRFCDELQKWLGRSGVYLPPDALADPDAQNTAPAPGSRQERSEGGSRDD